MKAFLAASLAAVVIAVGAWAVLDNSFQSTSSSAFTTEGARVDNPGDNLMVN